MRLFAVSDLHVDFSVNASTVRNLSRRDFVEDALIVAGDVGHRSDHVRWALAALRERFAEVFYVPGNHEFWVDGGRQGGDSLQQYAELLEVCERLGVRTRPGWAGSVWVVPLLSWYDASLDGTTDPALLRRWADNRLCRWPAEMAVPAEYFTRLNHTYLHPPFGSRAACGAGVGGRGRRDVRIVSFSHFVPRADLLPPSSMLRFKGLPAVAGSTLIERQLRMLGVHVHVFGHSHIQRDEIRDGVRYVQNALGYPRERRGRIFAPRLVCQCE